MDAFATFSLDPTRKQEVILSPLVKDGETMVECEVQVHDRDQNHLATGFVTWQLKDWKKVRTQKNNGRR